MFAISSLGKKYKKTESGLTSQNWAGVFECVPIITGSDQHDEAYYYYDFSSLKRMKISYKLTVSAAHMQEYKTWQSYDPITGQLKPTGKLVWSDTDYTDISASININTISNGNYTKSLSISGYQIYVSRKEETFEDDVDILFNGTKANVGRSLMYFGYSANFGWRSGGAILAGTYYATSTFAFEFTISEVELMDGMILTAPVE